MLMAASKGLYLAFEVGWFQDFSESSPTSSLVFSMPQIMRSRRSVHAAPHVTVERGPVFTWSLATPHVHFLRAHFVMKRVVYLVEVQGNLT